MESQNTTTPNNPVKTESTMQKVARKTKRILYWILGFVFIILATLVYWKFYFTYSEGNRAGLLQKFSNKGNVFKTYEGEMILSSIESNKNVPLASEKFFFSVKDKDVAKKLDSLQGKFVILHYKEKHGSLPWRGDTPYLVDEVRVGN
jgi:hypothetical protein